MIFAYCDQDKLTQNIHDKTELNFFLSLILISGRQQASK